MRHPLEVVAEHYQGISKALALVGGTHGVLDLLRQVTDHQAQLWSADKALIVTEVADAPLARELRFWVATGEKEAVIALSRDVLEWGRTMGCTQAVLTGRKGWTRALADEGWEEWAVVMGRKL